MRIWGFDKVPGVDGCNEGEYDSTLLGLPVGVRLGLLIRVFVGSLLGIKEGGWEEKD